MIFTRETDHGTPPAIVNGKTVTLTIDGQGVTVARRHLDHARRMLIGGAIPKLCATDNVKSFGSCRLCLVEIEGRNGYPASCTTPVAGDMVVRTQSDRLKKLRRGVMELYISDHPLDCLTCGANGDCELQDQAASMGRPKDQSNPYFDFDPSTCIVCSRCVRACDEVQGTFALTIEGMGFASKVSASQGEDFLASECVSCGACVQACPTASLIEKKVVEIGKPEDHVRHIGRHAGFRQRPA